MGERAKGGGGQFLESLQMIPELENLVTKSSAQNEELAIATQQPNPALPKPQPTLSSLPPPTKQKRCTSSPSCDPTAVTLSPRRVITFSVFVFFPQVVTRGLVTAFFHSHAFKGSSAPGSASCRLVMGQVALSPTYTASSVRSSHGMEYKE